MQHITKDGALCMVCFEWTEKSQLYQCDQCLIRWDMCRECATDENFTCIDCLGN
jgi:hypothetical protein